MDKDFYRELMRRDARDWYSMVVGKIGGVMQRGGLTNAQRLDRIKGILDSFDQAQSEFMKEAKP